MQLLTIGSGSKGNCHLLMTEQQSLIVDAGVPVKDIKRAVGYDLSSFVGAIVSHAHADHSKALTDLNLMGIPTFTPYESEMERQTRRYGEFVIKSFALKNSEGRWLHTNGDCSECPVHGFLINAEGKSILYVTDFMYMPLVFRKQNLQTMIIGCNYEEDAEIENSVKNYHVRLGHASLSTVKEMVKANRTESLRHIVLCHLSASADADRMVREVQEAAGVGVTVNIAEPGKTIDLGDTPF